MNLKEKRAYLGEYQRIQNKIFGLTHEIEKWKSLGEKVNNSMSATGVHGGDNSSKVERSAVNTSDIIQDIQKDIDSAVILRSEIVNIIQTRCSRMRYQELLTMRFVNGMSTSKIAKIQKKEEKTIANAITSALNNLDI